MGITGCLQLVVTEKTADDGQALTESDPAGREGVAEIVDANIGEVGALSEMRPPCLRMLGSVPIQRMWLRVCFLSRRNAPASLTLKIGFW